MATNESKAMTKTGLTRKTLNLYPATVTALRRLARRHRNDSDTINRGVLMYDFMTRYIDETGALTLIDPKTGERNTVVVSWGEQ